MYHQLLIYYFTGTGNSLRVAQWMAEAGRARGVAAQVTALEAAHPAEEMVGAGQLLGVVGPTHGFTAPWWVIRFALLLPRGKGTDAFVLFNRAGMKFGRVFVPGLEGTAAYLIALILWLKGYRVRGVTGMDMPSNWTVIHPSLGRASVEAIIGRAKPKVESFITQMLDGTTAFHSILSLLLGLLLLPVSLAYLLMGRFFLSKLFFASVRCNGCGVCASTCPVGGIQMKRLAGKEARPYWTFVCESCSRCINFCPRGAVEASYPLGALLFYLANIPLAALALDLLGRWLVGIAGLKGGVVEWILQYPYKLLAIMVGYWLFSLFLRVPLFNRLVTVLTPTHYYARYREPDTKLAEMKKERINSDISDKSDKK